MLTDEIMTSDKAMVKYFEDTPVDFFLVNGEPWFTAEAIGRALQYANPRIAVMRIRNQHRKGVSVSDTPCDNFVSSVTETVTDEFDGFVSVIKMMTEGGVQELTVFSIEGLNLICMFSLQPRARAFRKWAVSVLKEIQMTGKYDPDSEDDDDPIFIEGNVPPGKLRGYLEYLTDLVPQKVKSIRIHVCDSDLNVETSFYREKTNSTLPGSGPENTFKFIVEQLKDRVTASCKEGFNSGKVVKNGGYIYFHLGWLYRLVTKTLGIDLRKRELIRVILMNGGLNKVLYLDGDTVRAYGIPLNYFN